MNDYHVVTGIVAFPKNQRSRVQYKYVFKLNTVVDDELVYECLGMGYDKNRSIAIGKFSGNYLFSANYNK